MSTAPRFLTINDVSDTLNVSPRQVRVLLASGELRGIQIGGRGEWRIEGVELENFIARQYDQTDARQQRADSTSGDNSNRSQQEDTTSSQDLPADVDPNEV